MAMARMLKDAKTLTVGELLKKLNKVDKNTLVWVRHICCPGSETMVCDVDNPCEIEINNKKTKIVTLCRA